MGLPSGEDVGGGTWPIICPLGCYNPWSLLYQISRYSQYGIILIGALASLVPSKNIPSSQGTPTLTESLSSPLYSHSLNHPASAF